MSESAVAPWWEGIEPDVAKFARELCERGGQDPDATVLVTTPLEVCTPMGLIRFVNPKQLWPLWVCYVDVSRAALSLARGTPAQEPQKPSEETAEADVEAVLAAAETHQPLTEAQKRDLLWRKETGLDAPRFSD